MKKLVLFILLPFLAAAQSDSLTAPKTVDFPAYKMTVPTAWKIKAGCVEGQCTLLSPTDTLTAYDAYTETINLTINKLSSASYTAEQYATFSIGYLPKVVNGFQVLERKKLKPNLTRITYRGEKNGYLQTWRQYYHVKNAKVYIVTFSAETKKYDYFQPIIEPFLDSFKFK